MNKFNGVGRLTRDVELQYSQSGTAYGLFTLAINRPFKNKQTNEYDADFLRCKAFGKTAETIAQYVRKGQQVAISGRVETGSYENKDGQRVYTTDIIVDGFTFIDNRNSEQNQGQQQSPPPAFNDTTGVEVNDDDLPF